jgi:glycoside/pentoside/hexuronide:cation symporter, GPH family
LISVTHASAPDRLTRTDLLSYSAPMLACYFLLGPTYNIVPTLYAKYFGLELTAVAAAVLATRLLDALADPLIGYLSDRHRMRGGARKVLVVAGAVAMVAAAHFLFSPPANPSAGYYLVWNLSFFLAYSLMEIPHITWGGELTRDYAHKSTVYSYRSAAIFSGFILWAGFPLLPLFSTAEFTPEVLNNIAYAGVALMTITTIWSAIRAPRGTALIADRRDSARQIARSIILNRPLLLLLAAYLFCVLGLGMWQGLVFLYLDSHLNLGSSFALMQLLSNIIGFAAIPAWKHLAQRFDKATIWLSSTAIFIVFNSAFLMLAPGAPWWQAWTLMAVIHVCFSCLYMIVPSILSDVADYAQWKFHQNRGATYFALNTFLAKAGFGAGGAIALAVAGHFGVNATHTTQTPRAELGLHWAFIFIPIGLLIISAIFVALTPIDRRRHAIVRRRLESRGRAVAREATA